MDELLAVFGLYDEEELAEYIRQPEHQTDPLVQELIVLTAMLSEG
ncbi:hypothetical protein [Veillonella seminalis]|uniref:Uncharacterized protein n=1 Tax=Veillonella seminalis ACS-216-V-Col6b TaxID=883156 RepID=K9D2P1_9FIRM|nr:hypothetical protein [Veillonella seminalis]EKU77376.1 hypothetical protein HMPREF9282_02093 [Veillonella seminalis ACS-216-V-Col6b]